MQGAFGYTFRNIRNLRRPDVPVRIRESVVHIECKRSDMETIVAVAADNRSRTARTGTTAHPASLKINIATVTLLPGFVPTPDLSPVLTHQ